MIKKLEAFTLSKKQIACKINELIDAIEELRTNCAEANECIQRTYDTVNALKRCAERDAKRDVLFKTDIEPGPCPICNGRSKLRRIGEEWKVVCDNADCLFVVETAPRKTPVDAIEQWNEKAGKEFHGRWVPQEDMYDDWWECSVCGAEGDPDTTRCEECGAKMDKE